MHRIHEPETIEEAVAEAIASEQAAVKATGAYDAWLATHSLPLLFEVNISDDAFSARLQEGEALRQRSEEAIQRSAEVGRVVAEYLRKETPASMRRFAQMIGRDVEVEGVLYAVLLNQLDSELTILEYPRGSVQAAS